MKKYMCRTSWKHCHITYFCPSFHLDYIHCSPAYLIRPQSLIPASLLLISFKKLLTYKCLAWYESVVDIYVLKQEAEVDKIFLGHLPYQLLKNYISGTISVSIFRVWYCPWLALNVIQRSASEQSHKFVCPGTVSGLVHIGTALSC
jgi:hypothetical protein